MRHFRGLRRPLSFWSEIPPLLPKNKKVEFPDTSMTRTRPKLWNKMADQRGCSQHTHLFPHEKRVGVHLGRASRHITSHIQSWLLHSESRVVRDSSFKAMYVHKDYPYPVNPLTKSYGYYSQGKRSIFLKVIDTRQSLYMCLYAYMCLLLLYTLSISDLLCYLYIFVLSYVQT